MAPNDEHVAIVIAGAGARGAYEAGALSVLLPALEAAGHRPTIFVGTSAGAINSALLASTADQSAQVAGKVLLDFWRGVSTHDVWRPLLSSAPRTATQYVAEVIGLSRPRLTALFDTTPLRALADGMAPQVAQATANVRAGHVRALSVVTTDVASGRTVVFSDLADGVALPPTDESRGIDHRGGTLGTEHVVASAAIPLAFPPVALDMEGVGTRWYADGGIRLNAPLKPAISLGATRMVVVATHPAELNPTDVPASIQQPEIDDQLVHILDAVLVDRMVEDLRTLRKVNALLDAATDPPRYRTIPHLFVGPPRRDSLGVLAQEVYDGLGRVEKLLPTAPAGELGLLRRLLASGDGPRRGDLLSFLFFHPAFAEAAIAAGQADAAAALADDGWTT